jgi:hypothetical protein
VIDIPAATNRLERRKDSAKKAMRLVGVIFDSLPSIHDFDFSIQEAIQVQIIREQLELGAEPS